jgi:nitrogen fixation/metabolism regulation signal transduction histidine kinase
MFEIANSHGVNMWFQDDIKKALEAVVVAQTGYTDADATDITNAYQAGQSNTLRAVAAAFGLKMQEES